MTALGDDATVPKILITCHVIRVGKGLSHVKSKHQGMSQARNESSQMSSQASCHSRRHVYSRTRYRVQRTGQHSLCNATGTAHPPRRSRPHTLSTGYVEGRVRQSRSDHTSFV